MLLQVGHGQDVDAAFLQSLDGLVAVELRGERAAWPLPIRMALLTLGIADVEVAAMIRQDQSGRIPARRNETGNRAVGSILNANDRE